MSKTAENLPLGNEELDERRIRIGETAILLLIACVIGTIANYVSTGTGAFEALPGMAFLYLCSVVGLMLARFVPFYLPAVAWVSLIAIVATIPGVPGSDWVVRQADKINFLSLATPALAYGGLALSAKEFAIARSSGWKIVIVAICVMLGTYMGSVVIADLTLRLF
ncbi:hypothetical protein EQ718_21495 (plasmid) [Paracoccus versutus]|uniref:DUF340 domain-containing protein n=1 Tax=Paracoccus versutus TaxID=34007 RepID=A0A3D9XRG9_PARVE|nr:MULTISPECIES: hypothetical protein [Paracoccus]WGR62834.1 hypothetical protein E3U26_19130 [Paracoccus ferrooxidans]SFY16009.1 hypothetical protein SAMN04244548_02901 [Paracoccus pantotrophus]KGJ11250.1 membrane protein [Paracoccus versutus]MCJ1901811.1 hypothetical protein [Paracoccus versutus]MDF3906656.1 hypothetical protein [Paracoccus sp. AS002]